MAQSYCTEKLADGTVAQSCCTNEQAEPEREEKLKALAKSQKRVATDRLASQQRGSG